MNDAAAGVMTWLIAGSPGIERATVLRRRLAQLPQGARVSLLLEGFPIDGEAELKPSAMYNVHVLAPGCLCCSGQLVLRVMLARVLRQEAPEVLVVAMADPAHLKKMEAVLRQPPWERWIDLQVNVSDA